MKKNIRLESDRVLAVEGKDECNFFEALIKYEKINEVQIIDIGGKDKFKIEFPLLINLEGFTGVHTLGFIRDAEENQAGSAFASICDTLKHNGFPAPDTINSICNEQNIRIGIFIMPNNIDRGMLEDLCLESVRNQPVFKCVNDYIECCLQRLEENEKNINISKAKVQAYLSVRKPIVNSLGVAAIKGYWNVGNDCFSDIKQFLHNLFNPGLPAL